ncbi:LuxR C-terminal-related transcriptional regulator [Nocardia panacis]|nr:LuxR C-terminal-related transcriptional regulator [Nocardia panacis]
MSLTPHKSGELASVLRSIDDVLAHFQVVGDLAREARSKLAAYERQPVEAPPRIPRPEPPSAPGEVTQRTIRLTRRQQQVLELLVQGMTNRRIGRTLHITEQTVKAHLHMIYRQLNANDRTEAVVIALRSALVPGRLPDGRTFTGAAS